MYTFKHSMMISAVKVIVTMLVNESRKNTMVNRMIADPYKHIIYGRTYLVN